MYDRKFNKYENMEKAYDYFASEIENNKMEKELYSVKVDDEFIKRFKYADMKKIKGKVKTKNTK